MYTGTRGRPFVACEDRGRCICIGRGEKMRNTFPSRNILGPLYYGHSFILYANSSLTEGKGNKGEYIYIYIYIFVSFFLFLPNDDGTWNIFRPLFWSVIGDTGGTAGKTQSVVGRSRVFHVVNTTSRLLETATFSQGRPQTFQFPRSWDPFRVGFPKRQPARVGQSLSPMFLRRWMAICHSILVPRFSKVLSPSFL